MKYPSLYRNFYRYPYLFIFTASMIAILMNLTGLVFIALRTEHTFGTMTHLLPILTSLRRTILATVPIFTSMLIQCVIIRGIHQHQLQCALFCVNVVSTIINMPIKNMIYFSIYMLLLLFLV